MCVPVYLCSFFCVCLYKTGYFLLFCTYICVGGGERGRLLVYVLSNGTG